jgi:hypothetical protein
MQVHFNKITWYSKMLSYCFVFGIFPIIVFNIGVRYKQTVDTLSYSYVSAADISSVSAYSAKSLQDTASYSARKSIVGEWQGIEDGRYSMVIRPDGTFVETNDGNVTNSGSWTISEKVNDPDFSYLESGLYLIKNPTRIEGGTNDIREEMQYYKILLLNSTALEIVYLDRGNTISYSRKRK